MGRDSCGYALDHGNRDRRVQQVAEWQVPC